MLQTVTGLVDPAEWTLVDGHTHVWIDAVGAVDPNPMILNDEIGIQQELIAFRAAGGSAMVDCQPAAACGRDGAMLQKISKATGVHIIASTGFHLRRYYPKNAPIFEQDMQSASQLFIDEITHGLQEASEICAGFIKIACERTLEESPKALIKAAVQASVDTGAAIQVHTERGGDAEKIVEYMIACGQRPEKLILCHMDKRPELALHQHIANQGVRLEYDTFLRPKYHPEQNVWPLLREMIDRGYSDRIILATDLADAKMWRTLGGGEGAVGLMHRVKAGLDATGVAPEITQRFLCENITKCLQI